MERFYGYWGYWEYGFFTASTTTKVWRFVVPDNGCIRMYIYPE